MPIEYVVPSLKIVIQNRLSDEESLKKRLYHLLQLEERRIFAQWCTEVAHK